MYLRSAVLVTAVLTLAFGWSAAQAPQPAGGGTTTIRAESRLVLVDTVVTDKKGNYIRDLAPGEFHVWEDNQEQAIAGVSQETDTASSASSHVVLFFGRMPLSDQTQARDAAVRFIDANAAPNLSLAILNYQISGGVEVVQSFTADKEKLEHAVKNMKVAEVTSDFAPSPGSAAASFGVTAVGAGVDVRNHPVSSSNMQAPNGRPNDQYSLYVRELLMALNDVAKSLLPVPGRKSIVVLTPGLYYVTQQDDLDTVRNACNRANVALYTIDLRSTMGSGNSNALSPVATGTGGFALEKTNDTFGELQRIAHDQEGRYVIAYKPSKSAVESCHKIEVKVDRAGTKVRARSEYCNVKPGDLLAGTPQDAELQARATGSQAGSVVASMQAPFFYASPDTARIQLVADVSTQALKFEKRKDQFHSAMNVLGIAYKPDGTVGARFSEEVPFDFASKAEAEAFKQHPYHYEDQFEVAPGQYSLKVVFSFDHDTFAKLEAPLAIDPYDGKHFSLSGVAMCKETRQFAETKGIETVLAASRAPLVSRGLQFLPAGDTHFKKTDAATLYVEVYEPLLRDANPPKVQMQLLVVDRKSQAIRVNSGVLDVSNRIVAGNAVVPVGLKVPVDQLAPGDYQVLLKAADSAGNASSLRSVEFQLE